MTKTRTPLSVEQALQRIAGQLPDGVNSMAEIAHRKPASIRNWMDPDRPEQVTLEAAIELDLAFQENGGVGTPLGQVYLAKLDLADSSRFAERHRLLEYTQGVVKEAGEAVSALIALSRKDATETERRTAEREVAEAYEKIRDVRYLISAEAWNGGSSVPKTPP